MAFDYQNTYILEFDDLNGRTCKAELWEYRDASTAIFPTYLNGGEKPVVMKSINNNNTLYSPIRGTELSLEVVTQSFALATFYSSNDFKWRCDFYVDDVLLFKGYLSQEDSFEEYVDYNHIIKLRFTDNLGILKDIEFVKTSGEPYYEIDTFLNVIQACLYQTRLDIPIQVACAVFPSDTADVTADSGFNLAKVNTKTWLRNKGEFQDCYKVLSDIMTGWGCTLYQYRGKWWIDKWGDKMDVTGDLNFFDYTNFNSPVYNDGMVETAGIGENVTDYPIVEVETPISVSVAPPAKFVRGNYRFSTIKGLIRNIDLDEGTFNPTLSQEVEDATPARDNWYAYDPTYITVTPDGNGTPEAYILSSNGRLIGEQFLVLKDLTGVTPVGLPGKVTFESFYARVGDKISISCQASHSGTVSGTYSYVIEVKVGDRYVKLKPSTEDQYILDSDYTTLFFPFEDEPININDPQPKEWHNISFEFFIPLKSGSNGVISGDPLNLEVSISFICLIDSSTDPDRETWYKDINVSIDPGPARGDYSEYPVSDDVRKEFRFDTPISDGQRWYSDGAILEADEITLTETWKRHNNTEELMFKQILVSEYYKLMQRPRITVDGAFRGTMFETPSLTDPLWPIGFFPVFYINAFPDKRFALVSINDLDFKSMIWRATFVELYDITVDGYLNILPDTHIYKILYK